MEPFGAMRFTTLARALAQEARRHGLVAPGFRSPPRIPGVPRTIRRYSDGGAVVAVVLRGRSHDQVIGDLVEGIVLANRLTGQAAEGWRLALRSLAEQSLTGPAERAGANDSTEAAQVAA